MSRSISAHRQALADQCVAILRDADGFPLSTHEIATKLGDRLVTFSWADKRPVPPRPACWPPDIDGDIVHDSAWCHRCGTRHRQPVWRDYDGQDIRGLLNRLAKSGEVEKVAFDGIRQHYWRREDTDAEVRP
jgi:hypothetical protein